MAITYICDLLSENLARCANIEFELEAILSVQVFSQLNSDYYTNVCHRELGLYHMKRGSTAVMTI